MKVTCTCRKCGSELRSFANSVIWDDEHGGVIDFIRVEPCPKCNPEPVPECHCRDRVNPQFPCPVHGYTYAIKTTRLELLEERMSRHEAALRPRAEESPSPDLSVKIGPAEKGTLRGHACSDCGQRLLYGTGHLNCPGRAEEGNRDG